MNMALRIFPAVAVLFLSRYAYAFRTAADLPEFEGQERVRWAVPEFEYGLVSAEAEGLPLTVLREALDSAAAAWSVSECDFSSRRDGAAHELAAPLDGKNSVQVILNDWVARGFSEDRAAITDVHYQFNGNHWEIVEADLYLNYELLRQDLASPLSLEAVLVHEVGHILGLLHPCECDSGDSGFPASVMFPNYSSQRQLEPDDVAGICYLYASDDSKDEDLTVCSADSHCRPSSPSNCFDTTCGNRPEAEILMCEVADDCAGGVCVVTSTWGGVCSHSCTRDEDCPAAWACADFDSERACSPFSPESGCSVVGGPPPERGLGGLVLFIAVIVRSARRPRRGMKVC